MRRLTIAIVFLTLCGASACSDSDSSSPPTATPTPVPQARYLFLLYSDAGELTANADGSYVFKMKQVWNTVVAFADRPFRDATSTPLNTWVDNWTVSGFAKNPPNAALTMLVHGSVQITDWAIMTLSNPRFTSPTELDFDATFLTLPNGERAFFPDEPGTGVKPSFFTTQVFIDSTGAVTAPQPTPTLRPCQAGNELTNCTAAFCGDPGKGGCCTAASLFGCFDPGAVYPASGWIGYTLCGQADKRASACVLGGGPPVPTNTPTIPPTPAGPTSTPTNIPTPRRRPTRCRPQVSDAAAPPTPAARPAAPARSSAARATQIAAPTGRASPTSAGA